MCSNGLLNGGEPSTAFLRLHFDKELDELAVELATGVDRHRQGIEVGALDAEKVRRNILKASEVNCSFGVNSFPDGEFSIHPRPPTSS